MPSIKDKLKAEERNERTVRLWPEGTFYKAYERSAYLFVTHLRPYEVRKRYVQAVGKDVVSIGFPQSVLSKLEVAHTTAADGAEVIQLSDSLDDQQYLLWLDSIAVVAKPTVESKTVVADLSSATAIKPSAVLQRLREFNLANATPMQCMLLISELQTLLKQEDGR